MRVFCLGADQIDGAWQDFAHHLVRLELESKLLLASALRQDLKDARRQLWGYQDGAGITGVAITEVYDTPAGKACEVVGACGTESARGQIDAILDEIRSWAKGLGCTRVRFGGRPGWKRRLKGFKQVGIILEQEI
jgi:hypothetical protein